MGKRQNQLAKYRKQQAEHISNDEIFWHDLNNRIRDKQVIPIIGNSVRIEAIFAVGGQADDGERNEADIVGEVSDEPALTIEESLAELWADEIGYPLPTKYQLARVAQYNRVKSDDDRQAKVRYLNFLKRMVLNIAETDPAIASELIEELREQLEQDSFADLATELGYPKYQNDQEDPLRLLAKFDLPVYATTSHFDFMERALRAENKEPRSQVCFWSGQPLPIEVTKVQQTQDYRLEVDFNPTPQTPLVYHLYGLEKYPESLVLSEDDFLDFLGRVSNDFNQYARMISPYLSELLTKSSLLLLGYRLQDWDFRVLFRGLINGASYGSIRQISVSVQVDPRQQKGVNAAEVQTYLEKYFAPAHFKVKWGTTQSFVQQLWLEWNKWR